MFKLMLLKKAEDKINRIMVRKRKKNIERLHDMRDKNINFINRQKMIEDRIEYDILFFSDKKSNLI